MADLERRSAQIEIRAKERSLHGYAAVFGVEALIGGAFRERIAPGAFARSLSRDILGLLDHDPGKVLARTRSGTLKLAEDTRGLHFEMSIPNTTAGQDALALAERGDLGGMSFAFTVDKDGEHWEGETRELRSVTLHEISVVSAWPAYEATSVSARARGRGTPISLALARRFLDTVA